MGIFERLRTAIGLGPEEPIPQSGELSGRLIPLPDSRDLMPVTETMRASWDAASAELASIHASDTTASLRREFPLLKETAEVGSEGVLPGDPSRREALLASGFRSMLESDYDLHLKQVSALLFADDGRVREQLRLASDVGIPPIDDPRVRADFMSMAIIDRDRSADIDGRNRPLSASDPSLSDIARRVVDIPTGMTPALLRRDLSSGSIPFGPGHLDAAVDLAVSLDGDPASRDVALADLLRADIQERNSAVVTLWRREAAEVMLEDAAFRKVRHGDASPPSSIDEVVERETAARVALLHERRDRENGTVQLPSPSNDREDAIIPVRTNIHAIRVASLSQDIV